MIARARPSGSELYRESALKLRSQFNAKGNLNHFFDKISITNLKNTHTKVEGKARSKVSFRVPKGSMSLLGTLIVLFKLRSGIPTGCVTPFSTM